MGLRMKPHSHSISWRFAIPRRLLAGVAGALLLSLAGSVRAEEESSGQAWSRIIRHFDGTQTKSVKEGTKNEISEEKYDENHVLLAKRLFLLDSQGRLRRGVIMDARGTPLGSTEYGYDNQNRIKEERMFNRQGKPIQRKFPPGALPGVPENARHSLVFIIDPNNPNGKGKMLQTDEPMVTPVTNPEDAFEPGMPIGQQAPKIATGLPTNSTPVPTAPSGRKPGLFKQKKNP